MKDMTPIWQEIWVALAWKMPATDKTPIHRFNRLAKEHFPNIELWLDQKSCIAKDIILTTEDIKTLQPWHDRSNPSRLGGKLIIFSHGGVRAIVDGNNRVAHYIENCDTHNLDAILVSLHS